MTTLQVLVAAMHQTDHSLLEKMNIQSDAIVVNQSDRNHIEELDYSGRRIQWLSLNERGVGLSRNTALMRATADIVLFADDDLTYRDGYVQMVLDAFEIRPDADAIVFDMNMVKDSKEISDYRKIKKTRRLRWYNAMRYGACRIAVKRERLLKSNICFSLLFGGGARWGSGEDSLFLKQCLDKKMRIYACPQILADVDGSSSSWYNGITDKLFIDKGALLTACFPLLHMPLFVYYSIRSYPAYKDIFTLSEVLRFYFKGRRLYRAGDLGA